MIKSALIAIWACAVMFGASVEVGAFLKTRAQATPAADSASSETRKTKEINVPIIRDGGVKGFVVLQLSYVVDLVEAKKLPVEPDPFVIDEAFRYIFDDDKIDFTHLDMGVLECNFLLNAEAKVESKPKPEAPPKP